MLVLSLHLMFTMHGYKNLKLVNYSLRVTSGADQIGLCKMWRKKCSRYELINNTSSFTSQISHKHIASMIVY